VSRLVAASLPLSRSSAAITANSGRPGRGAFQHQDPDRGPVAALAQPHDGLGQPTGALRRVIDHHQGGPQRLQVTQPRLVRLAENPACHGPDTGRHSSTARRLFPTPTGPVDSHHANGRPVPRNPSSSAGSPSRPTRVSSGLANDSSASGDSADGITRGTAWPADPVPAASPRGDGRSRHGTRGDRRGRGRDHGGHWHPGQHRDAHAKHQHAGHHHDDEHDDAED
jgi:hypothetical protein